MINLLNLTHTTWRWSGGRLVGDLTAPAAGRVASTVRRAAGRECLLFLE